MPNFPSVLPVKKLDAEHPDYFCYHTAWDDLDLLYKGGALLKKKAEYFLTKRPKELAEVYAARVQRFTYQNVIGSALGWYQSAMFKTDPDIHQADASPDGDAPTDDFFSAFLADCDRSGTAYVDFFRDVFLSLILFRSAFVLVDLPKTDDADVPATLADQKASGALDPYLVLYTPRQAINWETDSYGNLLWVIFKTTTERRAFGQDGAVIDRWYYFDQTQYAVYEASHEEHSTPEARSMEEQLANLVDGPAPHALADAGRVPVQRIDVPDALWLANRIYLHAVAHLNMQNAYFWGLFMACLPVLYVKGEFTTPPAIVETGYLSITENGAIGYVEPSGASYKIASEEIGALREEMYRQVYLQAQGKSSGATASAQSGYSKEQDMAPSRDVLNGLGDILRAGMQRVLGDVATVHGDADQEFDVRGFNFDDTDEAGEVATVQMARDLEIQSDTLDKEIQKRAARVLMKDGNPDVMEKIEQEIDAAPTKTEQTAQQKADQQQRIQQALSGPATTGNPDSPLTKALPRFEGKLATSEL